MIKPVQTRVRTALHRGALVVAAVMCTFADIDAQAQIFRCTDADGHAVFSDTPCGSTTEKVDVVDSSAGLSPISGDGLSRAERNALEAAAAADAQRTEGEHGGTSPQGGSYTSTAASAQRRSY